MKNALLTVLAVMMLAAFAATVTWPTITDEAYDAHMEMMWN